MPVGRFHEEYALVRDIVKAGGFSEPLKEPMEKLKADLTESGPSIAAGSRLAALRAVTLKLKESETVLTGSGLEPGKNEVPAEDAVKRVAAVKFLRHMTLVGASGSQTVWVYSNPKDYTQHTYDVIMDAKTSVKSIQTKLDSQEEFFSDTVKDRLGEVTKLGVAWCLKAQITLGLDKTDATAKAMIDKWFAPAVADRDKVVAKLVDGFKKIIDALNDNLVIITDHPPDRANASMNLTEAYVLRKSHKPKTIFIEKATYANYDVSVLHDMKKNWTRILVHECTHNCAGTDDKGGYAYSGINPSVIGSDLAANNADNWAFFAADCGGALVAGEITRALVGTGGNLNKLPENWK